MHAAARHGEIQMLGIARIDDDGVQLGPVRRAVLLGAHPGAILRIVIQAGKFIPSDAAVFAAEQALRRGPSVPNAGLVAMGGGEPESLLYCTPAFLLLESRRFGGFLPALA